MTPSDYDDHDECYQHEAHKPSSNASDHRDVVERRSVQVVLGAAG